MLSIRCSARLLFTMIAATFVPLFTNVSAHAQNRFAVVQVQNNSKDITIYYWVRWGTGNWSEKTAVRPGEAFNHWYPYEFVDQNRSPVPQIRFATGIGRRRTVKTYELDAYASPTSDSGGNVYRFKKRTDAEGEDYIELFSNDN